ncbi:MAG: DNA mismatch repair endonuclease MutL [Lachnospiraceae bacterium]|jgi:DNA mismatch repair protein MutL|nr:DNA mismatch repair endonuclease MutL [Lachnospiraceae bacterium]
MRPIEVLDQRTIDQIAAGEVVERPASIVKELAENAIDAGATAVAIDIRDGGITQIRITDDGCGIAENEITKAFLRHATSKITKVQDLSEIASYGFRGEALSSIAAVSRVEMITKRPEDLTATRFRIEGGKPVEKEEIGAPDGTTVIVRSLFYNTPARAKFLKTAMTEASHVGSYAEQLAISNPKVSVKYTVNGELKIDTSGNGSLKDVLYQIYGREISKELVPVQGYEEDAEKGIEIRGLIAKPVVSRGNRNFENYYVNGRCVKSRILMKAIEDGYGNKLMQHQYPFTVLFLTIDGHKVDVNVHPAKTEVRFSDEQAVYDAVRHAVEGALERQEMIVKASLEDAAIHTDDAEKTAGSSVPEPFEKKARERLRTDKMPEPEKQNTEKQDTEKQEPEKPEAEKNALTESERTGAAVPGMKEVSYEQQEMPTGFLKEKAKADRRIIGQAFSTYWIVEYQQNLFIIDQHAAHEKVLYERLIREYRNRKVSSQGVSPPMIVSLDIREETLMKTYSGAFRDLGFEIEPFGGREYAVSAVPYQLSAIDSKELFRSILDHLEDTREIEGLDLYTHRVATEACKAAVKGNGRLSAAEAEILIDELLTLDDPYHCPHGRPTIISLSRTDLEKKFKRIV